MASSADIWLKRNQINITLFLFACRININSFRNVNSIKMKHFYIIHNLYRDLKKCVKIFVILMKNSPNDYYLAMNFYFVL